MKKPALLAALGTMALVSAIGCASAPAKMDAPATTTAAPAAADGAKPAEGSCGADHKKTEGSCGGDKKGSEGSCGASKPK